MGVQGLRVQFWCYLEAAGQARVYFAGIISALGPCLMVTDVTAALDTVGCQYVRQSYFIMQTPDLTQTM